MPNKIKNRKSRLKLGTKTDTGYEYSAKIDFREDLTTQISKLMREKRANDELDLEIKKLFKIVRKFSSTKKEKNLSYYYTIGKNLLFLDSKIFQYIKPYSVYRRIAEEIPEILPDIKNKKIIQKHLETMHRLGHINKKYLGKASWDQWYEIMKFKNLYNNQRLLKKVLDECQSGISGPSLRAKIKSIIGLTKKPI